MLTIDAQVHAYERDRPERPWSAVLAGPPEVTGDDMVAAMDAVGVDGALLVSPYTMYQFDPSYAIDVRAAHPDRFAMIKPVDPADPAVNETIADWAKEDGAVAIRLMMAHGVSVAADDPGVKRIMDGAAQYGLPVNVLCWGALADAATIARAHPNTTLVIDHLGLKQPFEPPVPDAPFAELDALLALAAHDNIVVKITGACTLSKAPYPFNDIWDPLCRIFDSFGFDRCMWGTDWTRAVNLITYADGVEPFRLTDRISDNDRAALMGRTLQTVYNWAPRGR